MLQNNPARGICRLNWSSSLGSQPSIPISVQSINICASEQTVVFKQLSITLKPLLECPQLNIRLTSGHMDNLKEYLDESRRNDGWCSDVVAVLGSWLPSKAALFLQKSVWKVCDCENSFFSPNLSINPISLSYSISIDRWLQEYNAFLYFTSDMQISHSFIESLLVGREAPLFNSTAAGNLIGNILK